MDKTQIDATPKTVSPSSPYKTFLFCVVLGLMAGVALSGIVYFKFLKAEPAKPLVMSEMTTWANEHPRQTKQAKDDWEALQADIARQASAAAETYFIPRFVKK